MEDLTAFTFENTDGEELESFTGRLPVPEPGEVVEYAVRLDEDGNRIDPGTTDYATFHNGEYTVTLEGRVHEVRKHYHVGYKRAECTVEVVLCGK